MCDTLVALPSVTKQNYIIFGKNSDRPEDEVQLITTVPAQRHDPEEQIQCTYIAIPQVEQTYEIILSQPAWMWGAEMGANQCGVVIGNEAVYTKEKVRKQGLLGMDLVRLGLERSATAKEALMVITHLLEEHGQGGNCSNGGENWYYHNSFLIADPKEAYVVETADGWWVAEKVETARSISNCLSIRGTGDFRRPGIVQYAMEQGYCALEDEFDFARTFSEYPDDDGVSLTPRAQKSAALLKSHSGEITAELMQEFLREHETGLCMHGYMETTGSQVSQLKTREKKSIHWFTGSPKNCLSIYKPYIFPVKQQKTLQSCPCSQQDTDWYWLKHKKFLEDLSQRASEQRKAKYHHKRAQLEKEIHTKIQQLVARESQLSPTEFHTNFLSIHHQAWQTAYHLIT